MFTVRPSSPARHPRFAALPAPAAAPRLPGKPRLDSLGPSLWLTSALRRTVWRWQRRMPARGNSSLVWC
jgi:hypothetical protein